MATMLSAVTAAFDARSAASVSFAPQLLHPGQFVLGPSCPEQLPGWARYAISRDFWLTAHPDLPVTAVRHETRALTLIGFILDPDDPLADDQSVLLRLLGSCGSIRQLIARTATLGGRWLLVARCDDGMYLFHDALGLRQALYTLPGEAPGFWVLSQPGLASDILGLPLDRYAAEFLSSYTIRARRPEYYWPGASTPLRGLRRLLPNHMLDLGTKRVTRYWPDAPLPALSVNDAVECVAKSIPGMLRAGAARFELALSITAGLDSRLVLAAARSIKDQLAYVTVRQAKMADNSDDLIIPPRLLAKLNLPHEIVHAPGSMSADFSWAFKRSVFPAHDHYGADAEAILARFGRRKVAVTGSGAEVGRCAFRTEFPFSDRRRITAAHLAWLEGMQHPFAVRCYQEWLDDALDRGNVKLFDLFEWEQGEGSWLATTQLEFDMAWRDIFTPYNCRALLIAALSVEERFRRSPDYTLFKLVAKALWPEVLSEPINPSKRRSMLRRGIGLLRQSWASHAAGG